MTGVGRAAASARHPGELSANSSHNLAIASISQRFRLPGMASEARLLGAIPALRESGFLGLTP